MVWRNDKDRIHRCLPSTLSEAKIFPVLEQLNLGDILPIVPSDDDIIQPTLLMINNSSAERLLLSEYSQQLWNPNVKLSLPVRSTQRQELPDEEDMGSCAVLSQEFFASIRNSDWSEYAPSVYFPFI